MHVDEAYSRGRLLGWRLTIGEVRLWIVENGHVKDTEIVAPLGQTVRYRLGYTSPDSFESHRSVGIHELGLPDEVVDALDQTDLQTVLDIERLVSFKRLLERVGMVHDLAVTVARAYWIHTGELLLDSPSSVAAPLRKEDPATNWQRAPVAHLPLSYRGHRVLERLNVRTLGELAKVSRATLNDQPNCSNATIDQIAGALFNATGHELA
jgi:hypothetical protein